mmetsp:Transcript_87026/g.188323  ORF Transcript_87026/g.188323 Transcript_87026/m.188323 type:complete len:355 (-) Transcript_87026:18-1082(-)
MLMLCGRSSDDLAVEDALEEHRPRGLGAHVRVGRLLRHEDAADLAQGLVHLVHLHLDGALADVEDLVRLLEELLLATLAIGLQGRQGHGLIVTGVHTTALRVKEAARAVGRHVELAAPGEARLEGAALALRDELLAGEEEGHVLAIRHLHGGGREVHAVLLVEGDGVRGERALNEGQGVGLARRELRRHELLLARLRLELDGEGLRLEAEVGHPGVGLHGHLAALALNRGAAVREAGAAHLGVGELAELLRGDGLGRLRGHKARGDAKRGADAQERGPGPLGLLRLRRLLEVLGQRAGPQGGTGGAQLSTGSRALDEGLAARDRRSSHGNLNAAHHLCLPTVKNARKPWEKLTA